MSSPLKCHEKAFNYNSESSRTETRRADFFPFYNAFLEGFLNDFVTKNIFDSDNDFKRG